MAGRGLEPYPSAGQCLRGSHGRKTPLMRALPNQELRDSRACRQRPEQQADRARAARYCRARSRCTSSISCVSSTSRSRVEGCVWAVRAAQELNVTCRRLSPLVDRSSPGQPLSRREPQFAILDGHLQLHPRSAIPAGPREASCGTASTVRLSSVRAQCADSATTTSAARPP